MDRTFQPNFLTSGSIVRKPTFYAQVRKSRVSIPITPGQSPEAALFRNGHSKYSAICERRRCLLRCMPGGSGRPFVRRRSITTFCFADLRA